MSTADETKRSWEAPPYEPLRSVRIPGEEGIPELGIGPGATACIDLVHEREDGSLYILAEISGPYLPVACTFVEMEVSPNGELRMVGYSPASSGAAEEAREAIGRDLSWSLAAWRGLPQIAEEIPEWGTIERIGFLHEWPLEEGRLERLRGQRRAGLMGEDQERRMGELESLVARNRPVVEGLLRRYL